MKRFISVLLCAAMMFSILPAFCIAADGNVEFDNNISLLKLVGVVDKTDFTDSELLANVTRADFLYYVSKMLKIEEQPNVEDDYFADLEGHWVRKLACRFAQMGVISVGDDRQFKPDDNIKTTEAAKILTSVLGYDALAKVSGGYPSGYFLMMSRLGIFPNGTGENPTLAECLYAFAKSLEVPCYQPSSFKNDTVYYEQDDENTLLKVYHGIKYDEGYVISVGGVSLEGAGDGDGIMRIGNEKYVLDSYIDYPEKYLGQNVKVYYAESGKNRTAKLLCKTESDTSFEIDAKNIDYLDSDYKLYYYKDGDTGKTYSKNLERGIKLLYNGAYKSEGIRDMFEKLKNGTVRLIDADGNGTYEYAFVKDYSDFVAGYADSDNKIIYDKVGGAEYNLEKFDKYGVFDDSYMPTTLSNVKENTILSVALSEDKKSYIEVILSNKAVSGDANDIRNDGADTYITVDGNEYKISSEYTDNGIYAGFSGTFYINEFGEIAYAKMNMQSDYTYGYITHGEEAADANPKAVQLEIFDDTGVLKMHNIYDNIIINGEKYKKVTDVLALDWAVNKVIQPQMIRFKTDGDGKITHIVTSHTGAQYDSVKDAFIETIPVDDSLASSEVQRIFSCTSSVKRVGTNLIFNKNTKLFFIPKLSDIKGENYEETDFIIGDFADMVVDTGVDAVGYRADKNSAYEDVVVCYGKGSGEAHDDNTNVFLVKSITKATDSEGFVCTKLYGLRGGTETSYFIADKYVSAFESLKLTEGDLLSLQTDNNGKISDVIVLYDISQGGEPFDQQNTKWYDKNRYMNNYNSFSQKFSMSFMYAGYKDGSIIKGFYDISGDCYDSSEAIDSSNVKIMVVDNSKTKGNKVYLGTAADIKCASAVGNLSCSKVFVHYRYLTVKDIVVYK